MIKLFNLFSEIIQLSKSRIGRDSAIVLTGNIFAAGLGFIAIILITRTLGPTQFGLFSVAFAVMGIASQFSDFGIGTGLVRFASLYLKTDNQKANLIFKVSLKFKLIITIIVFLIGFFASESLAVNIFEKPELIFPFKFAFIGAFGASLLGYISTTLQARQSYVKFAFVTMIDPFMKVTIIGLLLLTYNLNLHSALTTVIILPFIAFLIGSLIIPRDFLKAKGDEKKAFHELFHFSKWISVSIFATIIFNKLDILMLSYFKTTEVVGFYSAGYTLSYAFVILSSSLITVLLPEVSKMTTKEEYKTYIRKVLKIMIPITICFLPILIIAKPLILLIYGGAYANSIVIFQILMIPFLIGLIIRPINAIIYSINRTNILAYLNIFQMFFNFSLNYLLIPRYGAIGAAATTVGTALIAQGFIIYYIYNKVYRS